MGEVTCAVRMSRYQVRSAYDSESMLNLDALLRLTRFDALAPEALLKPRVATVVQPQRRTAQRNVGQDVASNRNPENF